MKTFLISYIISLGIMVAAWYPEVMARPFDILPRLAFYMAFPMAVFLGMILIMLGSLLGIIRFGEDATDLNIHRSGETEELKKSA